MNTPQKTEQPNLNLAIIDSVATDNFTDIGAETAEVLLDTLTNLSSTLESVPVIGTAVKLFRAGMSIKEAMFLRKLGKFLLQLNNIPAKEREDFVKDMNDKPEFKKEVGEKLIIVLDRFDDVEKARLLGLLFQSFIRKELHYERFGRYAGILDRAYLPDLKRLKNMGLDTPSDDAVIALQSLGLVYMAVMSGGSAASIMLPNGSNAEASEPDDKDGHQYGPTQLGFDLANILFPK